MRRQRLAADQEQVAALFDRRCERESIAAGAFDTIDRLALIVQSDDDTGQGCPVGLP